MAKTLSWMLCQGREAQGRSSGRHRYRRALCVGDLEFVALREADRSLGSVDLDQRFGKGLVRQLGRVADIDDRGRAVLVVEQDGGDILALDLRIDPLGAGRDSDATSPRM